MANYVKKIEDKKIQSQVMQSLNMSTKAKRKERERGRKRESR